MAFDQTIHEALQRLTTTLREDFDSRLKETADELAKSAEQDRLVAESEAMSNLAAQIGSVRAEADRRVADEVARVRSESDQAHAEELTRLREDIDTLRSGNEQLRQQSEQMREQVQQLSAELETVRERLAGAEQSGDDARRLESLRQEEVEARVEERQEQLARLDRLVAHLRRMDQVASLSDVLAILADGLAAEAPRTAVLVAAHDAFEPFRLSGFSGVAARPITRPEAAMLTRGLPFATLPGDHVGFAVPIEVGGRAVAMVYADDCTGHEETVPASWPEAVELLARHAAQRLETVTALRTVQALSIRRPATTLPVSTAGRTAAPQRESSTTEGDQSARRYARLLVSEIKLYNEATVRLGRLNRDLLERLRPEIERARRLYEERVPANVPARSTYFDDELVQTLADGDPALLGPRGRSRSDNLR